MDLVEEFKCYVCMCSFTHYTSLVIHSEEHAQGHGIYSYRARSVDVDPPLSSSLDVMYTFAWRCVCDVSMFINSWIERGASYEALELYAEHVTGKRYLPGIEQGDLRPWRELTRLKRSRPKRFTTRHKSGTISPYEYEERVL